MKIAMLLVLLSSQVLAAPPPRTIKEEAQIAQCKAVWSLRMRLEQKHRLQSADTQRNLMECEHS